VALNWAGSFLEIRRAYGSGVAVETIADRVIAPAMAKVGHQWEAARIGVWQEHRATQLCGAALNDLKDEFEARGTEPAGRGWRGAGRRPLPPGLAARPSLHDLRGRSESPGRLRVDPPPSTAPPWQATPGLKFPVSARFFATGQGAEAIETSVSCRREPLPQALPVVADDPLVPSREG
jgi:hypothetical protein